jgi:protein required for attachment to host cells
MREMNASAWVVVAESSRARLFRRAGRVLEELEDFAHPQGRARNRDIDADKGGRSFDSTGRGRHAMERHRDAHRTEVAVFARQIAARLEAGRTANEFERLVLIAPPQFLGELRAALDPDTAALVSHSIDKNLVHATPEDIARHLD